MNSVMKYLAAACVVLASTAYDASAQVTQVDDLSPEHPMAVRAKQAVDALLTGDAEEALRDLADVTLPSARGEEFERQVRDLVRALGSQESYRIQSIAPGPGGVMVLLVTGSGGTSAIGLLIQMQPGEPHQISGFRLIPVQLRSAGS